MVIASLGLLVLGSFGVAATVARLARVAGAASVDTEPLAAFARRGQDRPAVLAQAFAEADPDCPFRALADGLAEPDVTRQAAACNEALHDLSADLDWGAGVPPAALRLCVFATLLAAAAVVLWRPPGMGEQLLDVVGLGGGASLLVVFARREADRLVKRARLGVDGWVAASTGRRGHRGNHAWS